MNSARKAQFLGALLAIFMIGMLAQAKTWTVNQTDSSADFSTFKAALQGIGDGDTIQFTDASTVTYDEGATALDWAALNVPMNFSVTAAHPNTVTLKVWNKADGTGGRVYSFSDITFIPATTTTYGDSFDTNGGAETFTNCVFDGAGVNANRAFTVNGGLLTLTNCTVQNFQGGYSWPILLDWAGSLSATNTTFKDTQCCSIGGFGYNPTITLDHCAFVNTPQLAGFPAIQTNAATVTVTNTTFAINSGYKGGFLGVRNDYNAGATDKVVATFTNCRMTAPATGADAPLVQSADAPAIDGTFENCIFDGGDAAIWGSGKAEATKSTFKLNHCLLLQKFAGWGAALIADDGSFDTFEVKNSIIDSLNEGIHLGSADQLLTSSDYNLLNKGGWNDGNIGAHLLDGRSAPIDPLFANAAAGDYHLTEFSPCLGKGVATDLATDFDGKLRANPVGSAPDLGPFESFYVPVELSSFSAE